MYLSSEALWEVVRILDRQTYQRLLKEARRSRVGWLLKTLRSWTDYREAALLKAYRRAFPKASVAALSTYKKQLWALLEETLPTRQDPTLRAEIRIWQRLWLSVLLWRKGLSSTAEILWHQAIEEAVKKGWYEVALWGLSLLELYARDFHRFAPSQAVGAWSEQLLSLLHLRYDALTRKLKTLERYLQFRSKEGYTLPSLPTTDAWADFLQAYHLLIENLLEDKVSEGLAYCSDMLTLLLQDIPFPPAYVQIHRALNIATILTLLLAEEAGPLYESWYQWWEKSWQKGLWPSEERFLSLKRFIAATRLLFRVKQAQWKEAYSFWQTHRAEIDKYIFHSTESLGTRLVTAAAIYLLLLLREEKEEVQTWIKRVETWIKPLGSGDIQLLWWYFLRWYQAYREKKYCERRKAYRRLHRLYRRSFREERDWLPVLSIIRSLSLGLPHTARRRIQLLLNYWESHPEEKKRWELYYLPFPMPLFLLSVLRRLPLEYLPYMPSVSTSLPPSLEERLRQTLEKLNSQFPV